jgi:SEC-C motif domain protein
MARDGGIEGGHGYSRSLQYLRHGCAQLRQEICYSSDNQHRSLNMSCPCGSNKQFPSCCGAYISGFGNAPTPEALMRSRYTAYSQANIDYIARTMAGPAAKGFNPAEAKQWAESVRWDKLEVLSSSMTGDKGEVRFKAYFSDQGKPHILAEHSLFERINGQWFYTDCIP